MKLALLNATKPFEMEFKNTRIVNPCIKSITKGISVSCMAELAGLHFGGASTDSRSLANSDAWFTKFSNLIRKDTFIEKLLPHILETVTPRYAIK